MLIFLQSFQLQLQSPSGSTLPPMNDGEVTQVIKVNNPQKVSLQSYVLTGSAWTSKKNLVLYICMEKMHGPVTLWLNDWFFF